MGQLKVLIVEDEETLRESLKESLALKDYSVETAADGSIGLDVLRKRNFDIILSDLKLPGFDGLSFIRSAREHAPDSAIVLMSAFGDKDLALNAIRAGAHDYISKPFGIEELVFLLQKIQERLELKRQNAALKAAQNDNVRLGGLISQSDSLKEILDTIRRLSSFTTTVLITGESGTGKELIARAIHLNSPRADAPFIAINCGAIPETLIESELFGHKKGAFTDATRDKKGLFEEANGGTLFLDEIGELALHLQVKLLRALQEKKIRRVGDETTMDIDVRVVAATLRNLEEDVGAGRFRDDLFYRLNVVSIHIPPLRDRPEDVPVLTEHFIEKYNRKLGLKISGVTPEAMKILMRYNWRGNVRELENCVERAMVMADLDVLDESSFPPAIRESTAKKAELPPPVEAGDDENLSIKERSKILEIDLIRKALQKTKGNRTHAAKILEISHRALLYKLKEYELGDA